MNRKKGIVSTLLIILGTLCYLTGVILYFLDTGMFLFMTRGSITLVHDISGLALGPVIAYLFYLNRKIYISEIRSKVKREKGKNEN